METKKISKETLESIDSAVTPAGYRVLVADEPQEEVTKGGIVLPNSALDLARGTCVLGTVVSLGDLAYSREDMEEFNDWANPGDTVTFSKYAGIRFRVHGNPVRILNDDEIQAVIKDRSALK